MDRADVVVTCGQDGFYHRPVGYNVGFMHAKGQVITVCHADAVFPPDFLESIMASFDLNSPGKPASMVLLHHERGTSEQCPGGLSDIGELRRYAWRDLSPGEGACMSFRKVDAIRLGGFDEHPIFRGHFVGPYDLQWRLGKAGVPEVWHDESVVLWRFSQAATSNVSSAFLWEVWSKFIYPGEKHRKWLFDSVYLPLQQNPEIRKLRRLLRWIVNLYKKQDAEALGLSGFTGLQKLFLYIRLLPEAAKLGRRRQKFQAWVLGKLSKLKDLFKGLVKFSRKRILTPVSHGMTKS
jgi:GT2 family glycosyltransferase